MQIPNLMDGSMRVNGLLSPRVRVPVQFGPCGISGGEKWHYDGGVFFFAKPLVFRCHYHWLRHSIIICNRSYMTLTKFRRVYFLNKRTA